MQGKHQSMNHKKKKGQLWKKHDGLVCGMQKGIVLLVIDKVQSGWMVGKLYSSPFVGDLGVEHTLALITHNHWWPGVKEDMKERFFTCPPCNPHNHGHHQAPQWRIITLFECICIDLMDEPQSQRVNHGVVVIDHATK